MIDDENEGAAHPLFPAKDETDEPPEVKYILVSRNGEHFPGAFQAHELTDLAQIADQWGGGTYELVARNDRHITAKRQFRIPGAPKPLTFGAVEDAAPASVVPVAMPQPAGGADLASLLPFMQQSQQMMFQMMMQQSQQQSQMLIALLTSGREQMAQHLQQMQAQHDRSQAQQMQMMQVMLESQKGSRPDELILRGIELASEIKGASGGDGGESEGDDLADLANAAAQVFQGVSAFQGMPGPGAPSGGEAPPNGAAHQ